MQSQATTYEQFLELSGGRPSGSIKDHSELILKRFSRPYENASRNAPVIFLVDFSSQKYIYVEDSCLDLLGYPASHFYEVTLSEYLGMFDPAYFSITNSNIFPVNLKFLSVIPVEKYSNYIFSYNYKILNAAGNYINVLQRFSFVAGDEPGKPSGIIGAVVDITHFKDDDTIVQTIEETGNSDGKPFTNLIYKKIYPVNDTLCHRKISNRELQVLTLLAEGFNTSQIADRLQISKNTVNNHRKKMLQKTGCKTSPEMFFYAVKNGLI